MSAPPPIVRCGRCRYRDPDPASPGNGNCVRYPPTVLLVPVQGNLAGNRTGIAARSFFPPVSAMQGCADGVSVDPILEADEERPQ